MRVITMPPFTLGHIVKKAFDPTLLAYAEAFLVLQNAKRPTEATNATTQATTATPVSDAPEKVCK